MRFPTRSLSVLVSDLVGRNVGILGAGREGLAAWRRLRSAAPDQLITLYSESGFEGVCPAPPDPGKKPAGDKTTIDSGAASGFDTVRDRLIDGPLEGARLAGHEILVRSPGVSPYRDALRQAADAGVRITTGTSLWMAENAGAKTLCITGTKGKSTTSALLAHLLKAAGARVGLAGNIGKPLLDCDPKAADWWVVELSSYQICDLEATPWLAAILNLSDEHLDWHGGSAVYQRDKLRLLNLAPEGQRLANAADAGLVRALSGLPGVEWFNQPVQEETDEVMPDKAVSRSEPRGDFSGLPLSQLPGAHNLENLAAALAIAEHIGLRPDNLPDVLETFRGLPHRLARVGRLKHIDLVDDSLSTTPVATLAALRAYSGRPVTVLLGGLDRGLNWTEHAAAFCAVKPHAVVGLPDSGQRLLADLANGGLEPPAGFALANDMAEAVRKAVAMTPDGGVLMLSPGAPSFPHYRDYVHRGEAFWEAAASLGATALNADEAAGRQGLRSAEIP